MEEGIDYWEEKDVTTTDLRLPVQEEEETECLDAFEETDLIVEYNDETTSDWKLPVQEEEETECLDAFEETDLIEEYNDETTFDWKLPVKEEEEIEYLDDIEKNNLIVDDNDETTFDLRSQIELEEEIKFSEVIEETDLIVEENDVNTCDLTCLREAEDELHVYYKEQADKCKKELDEAKHNLNNAKQQMEFMVEEKKSLISTIENKNKLILETENKAAKNAEDAKAAFVLYTNENNQFKDVIHHSKKKHVIMQTEIDQLQEQLQKLKKIKDAEAQDQRKMIDYLMKKMAEVENDKNRNANSWGMLNRRKNEYKQQQLKSTLIQSQKENITSQGAITNLQNNIKKLSEQLKEYKISVIKKEADRNTSQRVIAKLKSDLRIVSKDLRKSVNNIEAEMIVSQSTITHLQTNSWNLFKELNDLKTRFLSMTDKLQEAEQRVIDLTKTIDLQNQDTVTASAKLDKLEKENEYLVSQLRMHARCVENEIELEKHKNAHFDLLLQIERVHNYSRISIEETALFDKTFIEQKLEDERAKEEDLAEVTANIIKKFASAKDRHGVIKTLQKRIEKGSCPSPFGNDVLPDEDSHMDRFPTEIHEHRDNKQYNERLEESKTTKNCHNKTEKNTNVFNISMNIAKSNVSFIDKKEERTLRLNGGSSDHKAIEGN